MSFIEMPNGFTEDPPAEEVETEGGSRVRTERLTAVRTRDLRTGQFVASPTLVTKKFSPTAFKGLFEGATAGAVGGIIANQFPQNQRSTKKAIKKLDPKLSVTLKRKTD